MLACAVIAIHALFLLWVIFGAVFTGSHPPIRWLHIASLLWGVLVEVGPWPCPLTLVENWLELRASHSSYQGGFLLHYLDRFVYPNVPPILLTDAAVVVAIVNLGIYAWRFLRKRNKQHGKI